MSAPGFSEGINSTNCTGGCVASLESISASAVWVAGAGGEGVDRNLCRVRGQWQIIGQSARSVPALGVAVAAGIKADYISQILEESVVHKGLALCHAASSSPFGWMRTNGKASAGCGFC